MTRYPRGVLVSCEVPWDEEERLVEEVFRQEVQYFLRSGFKHLYIFGTAGEGYAVDDEQFERIATVFRDETRSSDLFPQVGVIALSTRQVRKRIDIAYDLGFRMFQLSLPCWGALNDTEVDRFFHDACSAYPDAQFLHYNLLRSKRLLTGKDYARLVEIVPNLVATKNTSPDVLHTAAILRDASALQHFLGEATFVNGCMAGECSLLSSFAPVFPNASHQLYNLALSGDFSAALAFGHRYLEAVHRIIAPLIKDVRIDGAYDKALVRLGGIAMPLRLLSPYDSIGATAFEEACAIRREFTGWN